MTFAARRGEGVARARQGGGLGMSHVFLFGTLGRTGLVVHRLGLSATYRPGRATIYRALDAGLNYFFCFGIDGQMIRVLRDLPPRERQRLVIATGAYNYLWWRQDFRRALHKRLRQLRPTISMCFCTWA